MVLFNCRLEMVDLARKIKNTNGDNVDLEVIRYFINNDTEYLIYSLNETVGLGDDVGYTKLYASKIIGTKACIITDNDEWNLVKEIIKDIVRCNRDGRELNIVDLNEDNLDDIVLQDTRVFKLQGNLVNLLSENKKIKDEITFIPEDVETASEEIEDVDLDYEQLYKHELDKNKQLEIENESLKSQLNDLKEIIDRVKEIVE